MSQTGRAELLLALQCGAGDSVALEHDDRHWWGYQRQAKAPPAPEPVALPPLAAAEVPGPPPELALEDDPLKLPLQMPIAWVLMQQTLRDLRQELKALPKLTEADLRALATEPLPYRDLVPWARAVPGIRRHTDRQVPGGVDWPRVADALARRQVMRHTPRRTWQRWPQRLLVVLDFSTRLDPYRWDFHRLAQQLDALLPASALSVRLLRHGPAAPWQAWSHPRKTPPPSDLHDWEERLPPGTLLLLATDLGLFDNQAATHQAWLTWAADLRQQGCRLVALAPVSPQQPNAEALKLVELLRWSPDSRWRREQRAAAPAGPSATIAADAPAPDAPSLDTLDALVALAATALRIDPPLLRAWRSLLPGGADAGLEGRLWNHPHLQPAGLTCATRAQQLDADLARHAALPDTLRHQARQVQQAQHAHLRRSLGQAESLRWAAANGDDLDDAAPAPPSAASPSDALGFVKRLLHTLQDQAAQAPVVPQRTLLGAAELIQAAASPRVRAQDPALFAALDAAVARWRAGPGAGSTGRQPGPAAQQQWTLSQQGPTLGLAPAGPLGPCQPLGVPVTASAATPGVWLRRDDASRWLPMTESGVQLAELGQVPDTLRIELDQHVWFVSQVNRPWWAESLCLRSGVLSAGLRTPTGEWAWFAWPWGSGREHFSWLGGTVRIDEFGALAEVPISQSRDAGTGVFMMQLRLRWISPGSFLMGSPQGQGDSDERPQHPVTLSQGLWLAEGPCTQALWRAVMGENPSHFRNEADSPKRPVEQVSFDDVQRFLQRLRAWLPEGCDPMLPTEAQWEYAASAGTATAYPWGEESNDAWANTSEMYQGTTEVGKFHPNSWGLLDMHGNVYEWCADGLRPYTEAAQRDPHGDLEGPPGRAVRGGSWFHLSGFARSACRSIRPPDGRDRRLGFRLALRSSSQAAGGQSAEPTTGSGGATAGAGRPGDKAGLQQRTVSRVRAALGSGSAGGKSDKKEPR